MAKMSSRERAFAARVANLGCSVFNYKNISGECDGEIELNHCSKGSGMGRKNPNAFIHPICYSHHRGKYGLHHVGTRKWESIYGDQWDHVKWVYEQLGEEMPELVSKIVPRRSSKS